MTSQYDVIIIGAGITGLSAGNSLVNAGVSFAILEKEERVGGQIETLSQNGFTFETGPNTGAIATPEVAELFEDLIGEVDLEVAHTGVANNRWIWKKERFYPLPSGPVSGLLTPLFSFKDKLRILGEPFRPAGNNPDETLASLAERRLGKSFVQYAVEPFVGGVYAGDANTLIVRHAFPKLYRLDAEHGGFIRGSIKKMRTPKSEREKKATRAVFSALGGFQNLISALESKLNRNGEIQTGVDILNIAFDNTQKIWKVEIRERASGMEKTLRSKSILSTVPAYTLPSLMPWLSDPLKNALQNLVYAPVIEVSVGFDHFPGHINTKAFGGLIPPVENRKILGILFPSSTFTGRTPHPDSALFTIFMGGVRFGEQLLSQSNEEITETALGELYCMLGIPSSLKPSLLYVSKHPKAIPQYTLHMNNLLPLVKEAEENFPGLLLAGGLRDGIGLANRITQGRSIGNRLGAQYSKTKQTHE